MRPRPKPPCPLSAWPGVENCHCEETSSKRGLIAPPRPTARVRNRRRVPGRLAPGLGPRPTVSGGVRRPRPRRRACSGSCSAPSRPGSAASDCVFWPGGLREELGRSWAARWAQRSSNICPSRMPPRPERGSGPVYRQGRACPISSLVLPAVRAQKATKTVASTHASALTTTRVHRNARA